MAKTDIVIPQGVALDKRRYGVFSWGLLMSALLLLLVVVVLAVVLFVAVDNSTLVLIILVVCLVAVGVSACLFLEWLHRRALRRRDEGARAWIHRTISGKQLAIETEPAPLPEPSVPSLTPRSSWIHWAPWKTARSTGVPSSRSTDTPSSRSTGPPSSRSTDSPFYTIVSRNGR
ncbi:uncharacterized protein LOC110829647 [Zootermopsis nevadensis]|uniref:uncharacterized protein LOC110829647 n=1 Tax=Zootermopsis nevadensis TaxID=136037 RepID=UPI000B8E2BCB|nr:uncharacterized protein LOC110829647 [Zootermopsis nevadensis]